MKSNILRLIIYSVIVLISFTQCKAYKNADEVLLPFFRSYIDKMNKEHTISDDTILILGESSMEEGKKHISILFLNPKLMRYVEYEQIYLFEGYKTIIDGKSTLLSNILSKYPKLKYENLNQAPYPYFINPKMWIITLDKNNKILRKSP